MNRDGRSSIRQMTNHSSRESLQFLGPFGSQTSNERFSSHRQEDSQKVEFGLESP